MLIPRQKTPDLSVETVSHGRFTLSAEQSPRGTIVVFYRGLHCPICATYLKDLDAHLPAFAKHGVGAIAISTDTADRAQAMAGKIGTTDLRIGYGLSLDAARAWGLYLSTSRGVTSIGLEEPALFSEPGLFMVSADRSLYYGSVQTMPFVRPHFADLAGALDFVVAKNYPARGEYTGPV